MSSTVYNTPADLYAAQQEAITSGGSGNFGPTVTVGGATWSWDGSIYRAPSPGSPSAPFATPEALAAAYPVAGAVPLQTSMWVSPGVEYRYQGGVGVGAWAAQGYYASTYNLPKKAVIISESILNAGSFPAKLLTRLGEGASVKSSIFGGSHIGAALAEFAEEIYLPMRGGNACKSSCNWTNGANDWTTVLANHNTQTPVVFEGEAWNLVEKTTTSQFRGPKYNIGAIPAAGNGFFASIDVYVPASFADGMADLTIVARDDTASLDLGSCTVAITKGQRQRVCLHISAATVAPKFGTGNLFSLSFHLNRNAANNNNAPCRAYMSHLEISWTAPNGYENFVPTNGTAIAPAGSATYRKIVQAYALCAFDSALVSYGRNEANDGAAARAHVTAYKALIRALAAKVERVVIGNPPPQNAAGAWQIAEDKYSPQFLPAFRDICTKFPSAVNAYDLFALGDPSILMSDSWHPSGAGADLLLAKYAEALSIQVRAGNLPEDFKASRAYWGGEIASGTWSQVSTSVFQAIISDLFGVSAEVAYSSVVSGSSLLFTDIVGSDIQIAMRRLPAGGAFTATVDEGTAAERTVTMTTALASADTFGALHAFSNLPYGTHTLKITTSSSSPVTIYGVVAV